MSTEPPSAVSRSARMARLLTDAFTPERIEIVDDSARHAGHAGAAPGGESHFTVTMVSRHFAGLSRVARSRAVQQVLVHEFDTGLHALSLKLRSPDDAVSKIS